MISKESVGVEISKNHLAMTYAKATPFSINIRAHAVYDLEAGVCHDEKRETIRTQLKDFLSRHSLASADIWIGLPSGTVIQRVIRLPLAAKENLGKAIEYELRKYIPLGAESIYFRYQVLEEIRDEKQIKILVAAVKKKDLDLIVEIRNDLGIGICGVESAVTAGINGLNWVSKFMSDSAYGLAYAADGTVHIGCIKDNRLHFIRSIDLDDDLMAQSDRLCSELDIQKDVIADAIDVLNVYCHGPGATEELLEGLNRLPNMAFSLPDLNQSPLKENDTVVGMGLALKGLQSVTVDINLLPEQLRKKSSVIGRYLTISLVALVFLSGITWAGSHFMRQRLIHVRVERELSDLSDQIVVLGKVQSEITALQDRIDYLEGLKQDRIKALELLKALTETLPDTAWLITFSLSEKSIEIKGYADQSTQLLPQLEAYPLFANVRFLSTITKGKDGNEVFKIGFDLRQSEQSSAAAGRQLSKAAGRRISK